MCEIYKRLMDVSYDEVITHLMSNEFEEECNKLNDDLKKDDIVSWYRARNTILH